MWHTNKRNIRRQLYERPSCWLLPPDTQLSFIQTSSVTSLDHMVDNMELFLMLSSASVSMSVSVLRPEATRSTETCVKWSFSEHLFTICSPSTTQRGNYEDPVFGSSNHKSLQWRKNYTSSWRRVHFLSVTWTMSSSRHQSCSNLHTWNNRRGRGSFDSGSRKSSVFSVCSAGHSLFPSFFFFVSSLSPSWLLRGNTSWRAKKTTKSFWQQLVWGVFGAIHKLF